MRPSSVRPSVRPTSHPRVENSEMASRFLGNMLAAANTILGQLKEVLESPGDTDTPRIPEAADDDDDDEQQRQCADRSTAATREQLSKAASEFTDFSPLKYDFGLADNSDALQRAFEMFDADVVNCKARQIIHVCVCVCVSQAR